MENILFSLNVNKINTYLFWNKTIPTLYNFKENKVNTCQKRGKGHNWAKNTWSSFQNEVSLVKRTAVKYFLASIRVIKQTSRTLPFKSKNYLYTKLLLLLRGWELFQSSV